MDSKSTPRCLLNICTVRRMYVCVLCVFQVPAVNRYRVAKAKHVQLKRNVTVVRWVDFSTFLTKSNSDTFSMEKYGEHIYCIEGNIGDIRRIVWLRLHANFCFGYVMLCNKKGCIVHESRIMKDISYCVRKRY